MNNGEINRQAGEQENPGRSRRRWLWVMAGVALLLLVLLVGTPYLMAWSAKDWLRDNGAERVELQNIDFNPFAGVLVIEGLSLRDTVIRVAESDFLQDFVRIRKRASCIAP